MMTSMTWGDQGLAYYSYLRGKKGALGLTTTTLQQAGMHGYLPDRGDDA